MVTKKAGSAFPVPFRRHLTTLFSIGDVDSDEQETAPS